MLNDLIDTCVTKIDLMDSQLTVVLKYGVFLMSSLFCSYLKSKCSSFSFLIFNSLWRVIAIDFFVVRAINRAGTTSPTSRFRFPMTLSSKKLPLSASRK